LETFAERVCLKSSAFIWRVLRLFGNSAVVRCYEWLRTAKQEVNSRWKVSTWILGKG
jgi:hypothetical protein